MKLADLLRDKNLSHSDVAKHLDCAQSTVFQWVNVRFCPRADHLKALCELLQCSADDLLGIEYRKPDKINRALAQDLYASVIKNGDYDSDYLHQMATRIRQAKGGRITEFECWIRSIAEAVYRIELTKKPKRQQQPTAFQLRLI